MLDELYVKFKRGNMNVVQTASDEEEESRRAGIRKAQRERRKGRMIRVMKPKSPQHSFFRI